MLDIIAFAVTTIAAGWLGYQLCELFAAVSDRRRSRKAKR